MHLDDLIPVLVPEPIVLPVRRFYSASMRGFYSSDVHERMPEDVVEVSPDEWRALLEAEASGKVLQSGPDGRPIAVDRKSAAS
jgi:hypothetical protein